MKTISVFIVGMLVGLSCAAQERKFVITGEMTRDSLRMNPQAITRLYLNHTVDGEDVVIDSAIVKDKKFRFEGVAPQYTEAAFISGFDNGNVQLLLEEGNIVIKPFDGHYPMGAEVTGTRNNDIFNGYNAISKKNSYNARMRMDAVMDALPENMRNDDQASYPYRNATYHANSVYYKLEVMDYFREHIDSEAALFMIKYNLYFMFTPKVVERQLLRSVPLKYRNHPLYLDLVNQIKASNLKEGAPAPDIAGLTPDGKEVKLSDLQGKYVLLDFWASWCGPCRREFPFIKEALAASEASDKFVVYSYSIDSKRNEWVGSIDKNDLKHKNWIHVSTLKGWSSEAVSLFNVQGVPHTVLLNPKGQVVAFNLRGEELVNKVKRIVEGVEKYE